MLGTEHCIFISENRVVPSRNPSSILPNPSIEKSPSLALGMFGSDLELVAALPLRPLHELVLRERDVLLRGVEVVVEEEKPDLAADKILSRYQYP